jgi:signal transduction histidine kinase
MQEQNQKPWNHDSREALGLLMSCKLAELHKGQISVEGSLESGYRYVVSLPQLELAQKRL